MVKRPRRVPLLLSLLLLAPFTAPGAEFDADFDWVAAGAVGPVWDPETPDDFSINPGNYAATASLERTLRVLTVRTQVGGFFYGDEVPSKDRTNGAFALLTAMDRFGEARWGVLVLGGAGYYEASNDLDFHAGIGFDYRFEGPWLARGEAVYHHEFDCVALTVGVGYMF